MKKSTKLALALGCAVLIFYVANMLYHNYMFDKNIRTYNQKDVYSTQEAKMKVVHIIDPELRATNKINIQKSNKKNSIFEAENYIDTKQMDELFKSMNYSNDTLIILANAIPIRFPKAPKAEIKLTMKNVEKLMYNNKVICNYKF